MGKSIPPGNLSVNTHNPTVHTVASLPHVYLDRAISTVQLCLFNVDVRRTTVVPTDSANSTDSRVGPVSFQVHNRMLVTNATYTLHSPNELEVMRAKRLVKQRREVIGQGTSTPRRRA